MERRQDGFIALNLNQFDEIDGSAGLNIALQMQLWVTDANSTMPTPAPAVPCAEDDRMMLLNLPL